MIMCYYYDFLAILALIDLNILNVNVNANIRQRGPKNNPSAKFLKIGSGLIFFFITVRSREHMGSVGHANIADMDIG